MLGCFAIFNLSAEVMQNRTSRTEVFDGVIRCNRENRAARCNLFMYYVLFFDNTDVIQR